jgi:putative transposase
MRSPSAAGTDASLTTSMADILAAALQELIEAELTGTIGAEHGRAHPDPVAQRNGHRTQAAVDPGRDLEVGIPKLRKGSFFPSCSNRAGGSTRRCGR